MAEVWEQAVLLAGMILFAVLAGLLYYLTSDSYRKSKKMAQLGHEVTTLWTVCARCCLFCVGPAYRKKWESENRQYRTEDYGQPDSNWKKVDVGKKTAEWQHLPRGDEEKKKQQIAISRAVAKLTFVVMREMIDAAVTHVIATTRADNSSGSQLKRFVSKTKLHDEPQRLQQSKQEAKRLESEAEALAMQMAAEDDREFQAKWGSGLIAALPPSSVLRRSVADPLATPSGSFSVPDATIGYADLDFNGGPRGRRSTDDPSKVRRLNIFSRPLTLAALRRHDRNVMLADYKSLPTNFPKGNVYLPETRMQNRTNRILPLPQSRVRLADDGQNNGYINASYVRGADGQPERFIATQEPMTGQEPGKVSTMADFWEMVWQGRVRVIVKLNPQTVKPYFPTSKQTSVTHGIITIKLGVSKQGRGFSTVNMVLSRRGSTRPRQLEFLQLHGWNQESTYPTPGTMSLLAAKVAARMRTSPEPVVVQCDFGVGRSGVFLALTHGLAQLKSKRTVDVLGIVAAIREDRAGAVSTFDLYNYVHQVLSAESVQGIAAPPAYEDAPPAFSEEEEGEEEVPVTESLIRNDVALEFALDNDTLNERKIDKVATDRALKMDPRFSDAAVASVPRPSWPDVPPPPRK